MKLTRKLAYLCVVAIAMGVASCGSSDNGDNVQYIPVQFTEDGAWCFINAQGERIGTQEWEFMPTVVADGIFTARTDSGLTVYKWKGDEAMPIDSLTNLVSVGVYSEGLLPVTPSMQRIRVVDSDGDVVFVLNPINGQEVSSCSSRFSDGLLVVTNSEGKAGVVNRKGEVVVEPKYGEISDFKDGYALAANYNYNDYDAGPSYFVLDKEGKATPVKGKFGYGEGDCFNVPQFVNGAAYVTGEMDTVDYTFEEIKITVDGKAAVEKNPVSNEVLPNGNVITTTYTDDNTTAVWKDKDGKELVKLNGYPMVYGKYVTVNDNDSIIIYDQEGKKLNALKGNYTFIWAGGSFGPVLIKYADDYTSSEYVFLNAEGQPLEMQKVYGIGTSNYLPTDEEDFQCSEYVTSAYVDVTAAAAKIVSMASGSLKGKDYYYLGESVSDILNGENARYYSGSGRKFSLPTDSTGRIANGDGFWISAEAKASQDLVAPTYQRYFQVHHYDYYGRAWGYNRSRQVGVHFNPSAKVESFDIMLHTNHPSGARLREAVSRRMKKEGYTLVNTNPNYDEYTNGSNNVIIYGSNESKGIGALVGNKSVANMRDADKAALAANIY